MPGQACCLLNDGHSDGHMPHPNVTRPQLLRPFLIPHLGPPKIPQWGGAQCLPKQQGGEIKSHNLCGG